ncbi:MAG: hypothetical protein ACYC5O_07815 [Anaerolineae bacterium]
MSALPDTIDRDRQRLRRLVELVPDEDVPTLLRIVDALAAEDPVLAAIENAPLDDEGELSDETVARLAEADRAIAEGRVISDEELRRRLEL